MGGIIRVRDLSAPRLWGEGVSGSLFFLCVHIDDGFASFLNSRREAAPGVDGVLNQVFAPADCWAGRRTSCGRGIK